MSSLDQIAVKLVEKDRSDMVRSILSEVVTLLERWLEQGEPGILDLKSLPLSPADNQLLEETLGRGELTISMDVLGSSQMVETAFSGVWYVTHRNEQAQVLVKQIEVIDIPSIVLPQHSEVLSALERLKSKLNNN
ncbi:MAG: hypothetical protein H8D24_06475 [Gammaproteobacteria bacterium]|uniref:HupH hydrogenase expression protein C-terminal domain-containing protein n=1 Tax=Candidatus Thiopontia autotrophica TaxID=2841688 RepID=A0A8J6P8Y4_9GAMM|nr:hypothetical protein [Candidatus Thiopontia autotrophica]